MSTASKVTFAASCMFAVGTFVGVNYVQRAEREALRQGPIKDAERMAAREMNKKQKTNEMEHQEQVMLRRKYEELQPLSNEIIRGEEDDPKAE